MSEELSFITAQTIETNVNQLNPSLARLYSHYTLERMGRSGLKTWSTGDFEQRLGDAFALVDIGLELAGSERDWQAVLRRAGEILEWLSHPAINQSDAPLTLLSAACYQLSGYSAMASAVLHEAKSADKTDIIWAFLKGEFSKIEPVVIAGWIGEPPEPSTYENLAWSDHDFSARLSEILLSELRSIIGVFISFFRWGDLSKWEPAQRKLDAVAKIALHGQDQYSWLLARLISKIARNYFDTSLRNAVAMTLDTLAQDGRNALETYLRLAYRSNRPFAWASQRAGIELVGKRESFALCTPTGSGKTTIAEIAILQSLFDRGQNDVVGQPIALYIVPSRSLASQVENRLSTVLAPIEGGLIQVTDLYGGHDIGHAEMAFLHEARPSVLICTFEKADALLRNLGAAFVSRISVIILDEAHGIQWDKGSKSFLDDRPLRLETLCARLFTYIDPDRVKRIALSAVSKGIEKVVGSWVTGDENPTVETRSYRSTRQLIGRLISSGGGKFEIEYDLLDGKETRFQSYGKGPDRPYVAEAIPAMPATVWERDGVENSQYPYVLWSAINFAADDSSRRANAVLIAVTEHPEYYAKGFLELLETHWSDAPLPTFFTRPQDTRLKEIWERCLSACEDYFSRGSLEFRLLNHGIVLHHGKMPGIMQKLLTRLISERIVRVVVATSTLSEGVNLPFETVLVPTLRRGDGEMSLREFQNLAGRAGRPGTSVEGRTLVYVPTPGKRKAATKRYRELFMRLRLGETDELQATSALATLMRMIYIEWGKIAGSRSMEDFEAWLEQVQPTVGGAESRKTDELVDSLDSFILAVIAELEQVLGSETSPSEIEEHLRSVWQRTYAYYADKNQSILETLIVTRGLALKEKIYPDREFRYRIYRSSLPPIRAKQLFGALERFHEHLNTGFEYANWDSSARLSFLETLVDIVANVDMFAPLQKVPHKHGKWNDILHWWLNPDGSGPKPPKDEDISKWYQYAYNSFVYRFSWGFSSALAVIGQGATPAEEDGSFLDIVEADAVPSIAIWVKDLMAWGTLDPVVAFLLANNYAVARKQASDLAAAYHAEHHDKPADERLSLALIRAWARDNLSKSEPLTEKAAPGPLKAEIIEKLEKSYLPPALNVWPTLAGEQIVWRDSAGYSLARSAKPHKWNDGFIHDYDFFYYPLRDNVEGFPYIGE